MEVSAVDRRQPHIIGFDDVQLPYPPAPRAHLWHRTSRENTSMESSRGTSVDSKANTLLGDATPRAAVVAEQNLGTLSRAGVLSRSWEHHQVLPEIQEGYGPDESPYVPAGSQFIGGRSKLFLYRQDESTISESNSSLGHAAPDSLKQEGVASNDEASKEPLFLSREQTEFIMLEAEKSVLTDRDLKDGEIMVYGENALRRMRRKKHEEAKKRARKKADDVGDIEELPVKLTREASFDESSHLRQPSPPKVKIVNMEFPRTSKNKQQHNIEIIATEDTYSSLIAKNVTPITPGPSRIAPSPGNSQLDPGLSFYKDRSGLHHVDIEGVASGSMEQLVAFGSIVASERGYSFRLFVCFFFFAVEVQCVTLR